MIWIYFVILWSWIHIAKSDDIYHDIVLFKYHKMTDHLENNIRKATRQLMKPTYRNESYQMYSDYRVMTLLWYDDLDGPTKEQREELIRFDNLLGKDNVQVFGVQEISTRWPKWRSTIEEIPDIKLDKWEWELANIPELWFAASNQLDFRYLWVIEGDVSWTGSIYDILNAMTDVKADFVCKGEHYRKRVIQDWMHVNKHNGWAKEDNIHGCLIQVTRYSKKFLKVLVQHLDDNKWAYCEVLAPTVCYEYDGCIVKGLEDAYVPITGKPFSHTMHKIDNVTTWQDIVYRDEHLGVQLFYHPIKL